jgi:hypothetical protein
MRKRARIYINADVGCDAARLLAALPDSVQPFAADKIPAGRYAQPTK